MVHHLFFTSLFFQSLAVLSASLALTRDLSGSGATVGLLAYSAKLASTSTANTVQLIGITIDAALNVVTRDGTHGGTLPVTDALNLNLFQTRLDFK